MEIVLAESLGFCMGVKRAVDLAYRALEKADRWAKTHASKFAPDKF